ncbi:MAG: FAD-dependent oxidoreductase [Pseudomonadota bacterium]
MKVAVVGSGIAGLSAAWLLGQEHQVTIFEKHEQLGMDARSLDVSGEGDPARIDVPLRVFFDGFYPNLTALYQQLGIESGAINYSASFCTLNEKAYFRYDNYRLGGFSVPFFKGSGSLKPRALRIGWDIVRLFRLAPRALAQGIDDDTTLEAFLAAHRFSTDFAEGFLYPAFAAICTCSLDSVKAYPAGVILDYLNSGLLLSSMRRVTQGTREVVGRLSQHTERIHLCAPVLDVARNECDVSVRTAEGTATFDHVVIATQANQAIRLLQQLSAEERETLSAFSYEPSRVVIHRDTRLAPRGGPAQWAPVNFLRSEDDAAPMATIWMNAIQAMPGSSPVFQTWNPVIEPDPSLVLGQAEFERPVVNAGSLQGLRRLAELHEQPDRRVWFCGSYASHGIPLLESAVRSAQSIAKQLGVKLGLKGGSAMQ